MAGPSGLSYFDQSRLTSYITQLEPLGFDFHIHAIGDRGVHEALNAIEQAGAANCPKISKWKQERAASVGIA